MTWPLRVRLVVAVVLLVAVGLAVTGFAAVAVLRTYLLGEVDGELQATARSTVAAAQRGPFPQHDDQRLQLPSAYVIAVTGPSGRGSWLRAPTQENPYPPQLPRLTASTAQRLAGDPFTVGSTHGPTRWRVIVTPLSDGSGGAVTVAVSLAEVDNTVGRLIAIIVVVGAAVLVVVAGMGYLLVRGSLRPLAAVEETAAAIAAGDLSRRVQPQDERTEVGRLSGALNGMLTQIEDAFQARSASEAAARESEARMRRFVGDASHELRTPLTSIRGFSELYRQGAAGDPESVGRLMQRIEDESTRMGALVDDLLLLARLDQERPMEREPVDLGALARDAAHDTAAVAPGRVVTLDVEAGQDLTVLGDDARLRQVLANLLGNALTHTPDGTAVEVLATADPAARVVAIEVADHGPGLEAHEADRVFERFYRADPSRSRAAGGTGLGLSIVAAIVSGHGGRVSVRSSPGAGTTFRVELPQAAPP